MCNCALLFSFLALLQHFYGNDGSEARVRQCSVVNCGSVSSNSVFGSYLVLMLDAAILYVIRMVLHILGNTQDDQEVSKKPVINKDLIL